LTLNRVLSRAHGRDRESPDDAPPWAIALEQLSHRATGHPIPEAERFRPSLLRASRLLSGAQS